jgi:hypothetical protein
MPYTDRPETKNWVPQHFNLDFKCDEEVIHDEKT